MGIEHISYTQTYKFCYLRAWDYVVSNDPTLLRKMTLKIANYNAVSTFIANTHFLLVGVFSCYYL